jgi:UDP-N-acetylglucosamine transferase subunit ALG13
VSDADVATRAGAHNPSDTAGGPVRLKVCLAASGGGHVRQILDLADVWSGEDHFFVTEDTALGRSIAGERRAYFVTHVAMGQARLGSPLRMGLAALRNLFQSARVILGERPDVVISTGAGSVFFTVLFARLIGARVVLIESLARFDRLSMFSRMAAPFAHEKIVQSPALQAFWPDARVFDPIRQLSRRRPRKAPRLFATVGATLPFDRLIESVAELKAGGEIPEEVLFQTGEGGRVPDVGRSFETLPFDEVLAILREADIVVCHGGTGSLITALREGCRVVAMPRLFKLGEHYDDHQEEITSAFHARGLIAVANSVDELRAALAEVRAREPVIVTSDPAALAEHLRGQLAQLRASKSRRAA